MTRKFLASPLFPKGAFTADDQLSPTINDIACRKGGEAWYLGHVATGKP